MVHKRRMLLLALGGVAVLAFGAGSSVSALLTGGSGGVQESAFVVGNDAAATTASQVFRPIPGAALAINMPAGDSDLLRASFSAESACWSRVATNAPLTFCSVRIVLVNRATGAIIRELTPGSGPSGVDFAFDSTNAGRDTSASWESHAMDRFTRVSTRDPRALIVRAEWRTAGTNTIFWLDDSTLTVEVNN
jgi:hypothetical protein